MLGYRSTKNDGHVWSVYFDNGINQISKLDEYKRKKKKRDTSYSSRPTNYRDILSAIV